MACRTSPEMPIRKLPISNSLKLCRLFDKYDKWKVLAKQMRFGDDIIEELGRAKSPMDRLLDKLDVYGKTVLDLYKKMFEIHSLDGMAILKNCVDAQHHHLIDQLIKMIELKSQNQIHQSPNNSFDDKLPTCEQQTRNDLQSLRREIDKLGVDNKRDEQEECSNGLNQNIPKIPLQELVDATYHWNQSLILGKGGFGIVFKGNWKHTIVAIKRIIPNKDDVSKKVLLEQTLLELNCLNQYRHDNILPVYGYSVDGDNPCLVYQFMPSGNLEQHLRWRQKTLAPWTPPANFLHWPERLKIAQGVARGLQFMHTVRDKPLIHGDIKSANILLDVNFDPKIGDFGLAKEGTIEEYMRVSRIQGTLPYLPQEYLRGGKMSVKVDTYSFGVVLFELATGLPVCSEHREWKFLKDHVVFFNADPTELKDARCDDKSGNVFFNLLSLGKACVEKLASNRPDMRDVLVELDAVRL